MAGGARLYIVSELYCWKDIKSAPAVESRYPTHFPTVTK